jgi:O-antigen/teichoic acid export membrane protein
VELRRDQLLLNLRTQLLEIGNWLSISTILSWLAGQFFLLASISQLGITSSAYINIARNITSPVIIIFTALESILLLKCKGLVFSQIPRKILTVSLIWFVPVLLYVALTLFFGESLIYLLFGNNYIKSETLIIWFSVCHIIIYFIRPLYIYLRLAGKTKLILYPILVSCLFSLLCSYHFTTWFGIIGAMLVMCSKEIVILLLTLIIVFKINKSRLNAHI